MTWKACAKKFGDGLTALFGYPLAHENDVERPYGQRCRVHERHDRGVMFLAGVPSC
jgi:hypothetical protein